MKKATYHDDDRVYVGHVDSVLDDRGREQDVPPAQSELQHDIFETFHLSLIILVGGHCDRWSFWSLVTLVVEHITCR